MKLTIKKTINLSLRLCRKIISFNPDIIIAIEKGGLLPGIEISKKLKKKLITITIRREYDKNFEKLYRKGTKEDRKIISKKVDDIFLKTKPKLLKGVNLDLRNKKILLVDDAIHTGKTLNIAKNYLITKKPLEIKTAVLFCVDNFFSDYFIGKGEYEYPWSTWSKFKPNYDKLQKYYFKNIPYIKKSNHYHNFTELKSFSRMKNKYLYFFQDNKIFFRIIGLNGKYKDFLISNKKNIPRSGLVLLEAIPDGKNKTILELGTGSNALLPIYASCLKRYKKSTGCEIDNTSIKLAKRAIAYSGQKNVKLIHSDLFSNIKNKFDIIASNPPYTPLPNGGKIKNNYDFGGYDGFQIIDNIVKNAPKHINKHGKIYLIIADYLGVKEKNGIHESLFNTLKLNGFKPKVVLSKIRYIKKGDATAQALSHILSIYPNAKFKINNKLTNNQKYILSSYKKGIDVGYNVVVVSGEL